MKRLSGKKQVYVIAGSNGAGKTTFAREFLPGYAHCLRFINPDLIGNHAGDAMKEQTLTQKAVAAMESAIQKVIADHKQRNRPLAIWQDGKVVMVPPESLMVIREVPSKYGEE